MFYFKKIISYFDYYENGEKKKSCGHAKLLVKDGEVTVEIHIKNIGIKESCMCDIVALGQENSRIGRFVMDKGTGYYNARHKCENMDGKGLSVFDIYGFELFLTEKNVCRTEWEWEDIPDRKPKEEIVAEKKPEKYENVPAEKEVEIEDAEMEAAELEDAEAVISEIETAETEELVMEEAVEEEINPVQEMLYEDKWKQLCSTYPVCHPFGEGEEYITISPKDFVVLRKEYQNLVSNSFLLHSFYNYHHVILGKMGKEEDDTYYIGAPGNYFDREKKVAVMFGFEGFARSATGNHKQPGGLQEKQTVLNGDFGYYMKKVEI